MAKFPTAVIDPSLMQEIFDEFDIFSKIGDGRLSTVSASDPKPVNQVGIYWFRVLFDGEIITQIPFEVVLQQSQSSPVDQETLETQN